MPTIDEVFGISVKPILSYVDREEVDGRFAKAIRSDNHIVVYGSSKQGKTALRTKHVKDADCEIVNCSPRMSIENIYMSILRKAGVTIKTTETSAVDVTGKVQVKTGFKAVFAWFGEGAAEAAVEAGTGIRREAESEFIGYDLADAQSIGELLARQKFNKFVILENFHYLTPDTQKQLAYDLKTFHEIRIRFIILGVWREANQLLLYNGDLQDRVTEVPVEPWESADFLKIVSKGSVYLRIHIAYGVVQRFIENAYGNVGLFQEFLKTFCSLSNVSDSHEGTMQLDDEEKLDGTFRAKLEDQRGPLVKVLEGIAAKSRTDSSQEPMILPYYLVRVILSVEPDQLRAGIEKSTLLQKIREIHHREKKDTIRPNDIGNLLSQLPAMQKDINPPFLYYDDNQRRLKVVDTRQFFVLANINRAEAAEDIPFPLDLKFADQSRDEEQQGRLFE